LLDCAGDGPQTEHRSTGNRACQAVMSSTNNEKVFLLDSFQLLPLPLIQGVSFLQKESFQGLSRAVSKDLLRAAYTEP